MGQVSDPRRAVAAAEPLIDRTLPRHVRRLLSAEKRRRGVEPGQLLFVGVQNIADAWWCAEQAVVAARLREPAAFQGYLRDRLVYSLELGRLAALPRRVDDWLTIGDDLTADDMERLLARREGAGALRRPFVAQEKGGVFYVDPALSPDQRQVCAQWAERMGWRLADADQDPTLHRAMVRERRAEQYPTVRWSFPWDRYVLIGRPAGLTDEFVYELRVATVDWLAMRFIKPVAMSQADVHGRLFGRRAKRVQIHILATGKTHTIRGAVDGKLALETLEIFRAADTGQPVMPPSAWKCHAQRCVCFASCKVRRSRKAEKQ